MGKNTGTLYCRPEMKGTPKKKRTSPKWCPGCKMRLRGLNHLNGTHHKTKKGQL